MTFSLGDSESKRETRLKSGTTHIVINRSYYDSTNHQKPIGHRDIYLPMEVFAGVNHLNMGEVAHPHDLREKLETARDHCLRGNDRCQNGYHERWIQHSWRNSFEERVRVRGFCGITADVGGLSNVRQEETWINKAKPGQLNSPDR